MQNVACNFLIGARELVEKLFTDIKNKINTLRPICFWLRSELKKKTTVSLYIFLDLFYYKYYYISIIVFMFLLFARVEYRLTVEARDMDGGGLVTTVPLIVHVLDINDETPVFLDTPIQFILSQDMRNFTERAFIKVFILKKNNINNNEL